jgi:Heparinase II/III-like protein
MQCIRIILCLLILIIFSKNYVAEESNQVPFLKQLSEEAISGILKANYRETPIDEIFSINQVTFSRIRLPLKYEHPCLLFNQSNQDRIKMRKNRDPYRKWTNYIVNAALGYSADPTSLFLAELPRSEIAKLNAFSWFLSGNQEFLQTAKSAMMNISDTSPPVTAEGGNYGQGWGDWMQSAEALQNYAVSYDILFYQLSETERNIIEQQLIDQTDQLYNYFSHFPEDLSSTQLSIGVGISKNNHIIDIASGVASIAMVIDHPKSEKWFDTAISQLQSGLALIAKDGSYREGAYYGRFVASRLFPFFVFLKNRTGENLFKHPRINKFIYWLNAMEKPDGTVPDFDDAFPENFLYQPIAIGLSPLGNELRYLFDQNEDRYRHSDPTWVEVFCAFDDRVLLRKPTFETTFIDGGYEIFRGNNQTFGLLLAEPGRPYISNHDHIEPTSFTLSAFNRKLLIDSGYGPGGVNNKDRNWFTSGRAHNIPLVNGHGPSQNPVWGDDLGGNLENIFHSQLISSAQVSAYYQDTDVIRKILFNENDYFVVIDNLESDYQNRYSIPWHGLGDFSRKSNTQIEWQQEDVKLKAAFISLDTFSISTRQGLHTLKTTDLQHTTASVDFKADNNSQLISVFIPDNKNVTRINHIAIQSEGNSTARKVISKENSRTDYIIMAQDEWECEEFNSDAKIAFITSENSYTVSLEEATYFSVNDEPIFISDKPIDIILDFNTYCGYIDLNDQTAVSIELFQNYNPDFLTIDQKLIDYQWNGESICFSIDQSGKIQSGKIRDLETISKSVRNDLPMLTKLSSSLYPDKEYEDLNYYEKSQLRNEIIDYCGTSIITLIDSTSTISGFSSKIYGISTGLIGSMWDASENFKFNLPQSLRFKRKIGNRTYSFYDEGYITENGLRIKSLRFNIDNKYYLSHDKDFSGHDFNSLYMQFDKYSASSYWKSYQDKNSYLIELQKQSETGYIQTSYSQNEFIEQTSNSLSFQKKNYAGDLAINNSDDHYEYFLSGRRNGNWLCSAFQTNFDEENQTYSGNLYNLISVSNSLKLTNDLFLSKSTDDLEELNSYTSLFHHFNNISGNISISNYSNEAGTIKARESVKFDKWRVSAFYSNEYESEISTAYRSLDFSTETKLENEKHILQNFSFHPIHSISAKVELGWDIADNLCNKASLGLFNNNRNRIGTEFSMMRIDNKKLFGISGIIDVALLKNETIDIFSSFFWQEDGDLDRYEIVISQSGEFISPGIYISRLTDGFSRCEGYLIWRF